MNIAVLIPYMSGKGGTETVVNNWKDNFSTYCPNIKLDFILPEGSIDGNWIEYTDNVKVIDKFKSNKYNYRFRNIGYIWPLYYFLRKDYDVVVCLSTKMIKYCKLMKRIFKLKFKIVSWIHFSLNHESLVKKIDLIKSDYHFAISKGISKQLTEEGVEPERIFFVGNPISIKNITISPSNKLNNKFIYIGRLQLDSQKNFRQILDVFSNNNIEGNWQLDVYGTGDDYVEIKKIISENNLEDRIILHGWVSSPFNEIKEADYLLLSSNYEGFPMVLLEAISYGIPCISSNCPTGPEDIINSTNGYLFPVGDNEQFEEIIHKVLTEHESSFKTSEVKKSIKNFYEESYYRNIYMFLNQITGEDS
ncbi:hypothetical protein BG262_06445 [Floricoccus penangensis]|uniref:Glycosyl transferase family 1 domain-containing protein n=1 Tax=Floricoccus penangensis TaxID=1859475 RepID=A0A9Q5JEL7_9LACT|nr:glycosyltransferase [Floricoccus penangensis]OFI45910.1 hypothetical protein BG262_06445 [Floricoccus penangensis]